MAVSKRRDAARTLVESLGGKTRLFLFRVWQDDVVVIVDFPDGVSAAAASLTIAASGAVTGRVTVLLTPEEIDQAAKKSAKYTPPGR